MNSTSAEGTPMRGVQTISAIAVLFQLFAASAVALAASPAETQVDIRTKNGKILIAAEEIVAYDWPTHTITLKSPVRPWLMTAHHKGVLGAEPFTLAIDGKAVYEGAWTSVAMSMSRDTPVISVDEQAIDPQLDKNELRIALGYPTEKFFKGSDPRNAELIKQALSASGKLRPKPVRRTDRQQGTRD